MPTQPRLSRTWSSSFAPKFRQPETSGVGTSSWHKHDPVTSSNFFSETLRLHSPFYYIEDDNLVPSTAPPRPHPPRVSHVQPVGLPDPVVDALHAKTLAGEYVKGQQRYDATFKASIAATRKSPKTQTWLRSTGSWVNPFKMPSWPGIPPQQHQQLAPLEVSRGSTRASRKRSRGSKRSKTPGTMRAFDYVPWKPPPTPENIGTAHRPVQRIKLADRALTEAVLKTFMT